jgi:hypothetical protein
MRGGEDGVVVVPGKPQKSRLCKPSPDSDPHAAEATDGSSTEAIREWIAAWT